MIPNTRRNRTLIWAGAFVAFVFGGAVGYLVVSTLPEPIGWGFLIIMFLLTWLPLTRSVTQQKTERDNQ